MKLELQYPPANRGVVVVWGYLATHPYGGMTWQALHHIVGLRLLGFDVWFVDDSHNEFHLPGTWWPAVDVSENAAFVDRMMRAVGLGDRWAVRRPGTDAFSGHLDAGGVASLYRTAVAVFNVCQSTRLRADHEVIDCLVLLETDPVANQVAVDSGDRGVEEELKRYDYLFTYGTNIGTDRSSLPAGPFTWLGTRPPIVLEWWDQGLDAPEGARITTVGNWRNRGKDLDWDGDRYLWQKGPEFLEFLDLPLHTDVDIELALAGIEEADATLMRSNGWMLSSAVDLADPFRYRQFIMDSLSEFTVAKDQNIRLRTGWFSDRSASYLAAGRPVITQSTGFEDSIPTGKGLLAFTDRESALASLEEVLADVASHSRAARDIAHEYFSARRVLAGVVGQIGL